MTATGTTTNITKSKNEQLKLVDVDENKKVTIFFNTTIINNFHRHHTGGLIIIQTYLCWHLRNKRTYLKL